MLPLFSQAIMLLMCVIALSGCHGSQRDLTVEAQIVPQVLSVTNTKLQPSTLAAASAPTVVPDTLVGRWEVTDTRNVSGKREGDEAYIHVLPTNYVLIELVREEKVKWGYLGAITTTHDNQIAIIRDQHPTTVTTPSTGVLNLFFDDNPTTVPDIILGNRVETLVAAPTKAVQDNLLGYWVMDPGNQEDLYWHFDEDGSFLSGNNKGRYEWDGMQLRSQELYGSPLDIIFFSDDLMTIQDDSGPVKWVVYQRVSFDEFAAAMPEAAAIIAAKPVPDLTPSVLKDKLVGRWMLNGDKDTTVYFLKEGITLGLQDDYRQSFYMYRVTNENEITLIVPWSQEKPVKFAVIQPDSTTMILESEMKTIVLRNRQDVVSAYGKALQAALSGNWFFESDTNLRNLRHYSPNGDLLQVIYDPKAWDATGAVWEINYPLPSNLEYPSVYFLVDGELLQFVKSTPSDDFSMPYFLGAWRRTTEEIRVATRNDFVGVWNAADQRCCAVTSLEFFSDNETLLLHNPSIDSKVGSFNFDPATHTLKMANQKDGLVVNYSSPCYPPVLNASLAEPLRYVASSTVAQAYVVHGKLILASGAKTLLDTPFHANFGDGTIITDTNGVTYTLSTDALQRCPVYTTFVRPEDYVVAPQPAQDGTTQEQAELPMGVNEWEGVSPNQDAERIETELLDPATAQIYTDWQPATAIQSLRDAILGKWEFTNSAGEVHWAEFLEDGELISGVGDRSIRGTFMVDEEANQLSVNQSGSSKFRFAYVSNNTIVLDNIGNDAGGIIVQRRLAPQYSDTNKVSEEKSILLREIAGTAETWLQKNLELSTATALSVTCREQQNFVAKSAMSNAPWAIVMNSFGLDYQFEFDIHGETMLVDRGEAFVLVAGTIYGGPGGIGKIGLGEIWRMVYEDKQWRWCGDALAEDNQLVFPSAGQQDEPAAPINEAKGMDIASYCQAQGYAKAVALNLTDALSWRCQDSTNNLYEINLDDLCQVQYGNMYHAQYGNANDAYSWKCVTN